MIRVVLAAVLLAGTAGAYPPPPKEKPEDPPPPVAQEHWQKSINNLKQIGLACHNYHDANGAFPADVLGKDGKPVLSWRVAILPFLDHGDLYKQFKLDEAWDGPTNRPLLEKLPTVFAPVRVTAKKGLTFYQGFAGPDAVFDPKNRNVKIHAIADGSSVTALVVEAGVPVKWTKPADLAFDPAKGLSKLGGQLDGDFAMLFCDGHVGRVRKDFDAAMMKLIVQKSDGHPVDTNAIAKR